MWKNQSSKGNIFSFPFYSRQSSLFLLKRSLPNQSVNPRKHSIEKGHFQTFKHHRHHIWKCLPNGQNHPFLSLSLSNFIVFHQWSFIFFIEDSAVEFPSKFGVFSQRSPSPIETLGFLGFLGFLASSLLAGTKGQCRPPCSIVQTFDKLFGFCELPSLPNGTQSEHCIVPVVINYRLVVRMKFLMDCSWNLNKLLDH